MMFITEVIVKGGVVLDFIISRGVFPFFGPSYLHVRGEEYYKHF